ncbi:MAG: ATP-binding cassette domain-containing protein [Lentisphaeria bacterium]|nr:ATP-binding cassette domain-containing protein [Lentisphaerota bacterium]MBR7145114.1 ATP-binding cassette domain-containing protein [Lentisphaeria bacterium]
MAEDVIRAVGLTKVFRDFWNRPKARAVNEIDFTVREGEVVGLLGPNGSGKSTTVKMILGLLYPTAGQLTVLGKAPRAVETKKAIGYLPEESYLYKYLTAEETLDFFGSLFNLSRAERKNRIDQLLDMVGLAHARHRRVGEFSKGMARRIGLAQAMINDPSLLIFDEPTSGLDPLGCREVKDLIVELKKRGKTVLITSHLLSDVEDICDRVVILYGGKVRAQGSLNELLTVSDSTRIVTPALDKDATEKVLAVLRENLNGEEFVMDHPRRTLEEFFLDVIAKAKNDSVETSGALGGGIAEYLSAEKDKESAVLESLIAQEEAVKKPTAGESAAKLAGELKAAEEKRLAELTGESEKAPVSKDEEKVKADAEALKAADAKLDDILKNR